MKLANIAIWTCAIVVGIIAYLCVTMAVFVIWPTAGEAMFFLMVLLPFTPETWALLWTLYERRRKRKQAQQT
jgi:hypothetical protein